MTLWTNDVLVSARRIYEGAGFTLEHEYRHHSFGHDLAAQIWRRDLQRRAAPMCSSEWPEHFGEQPR